MSVPAPHFPDDIQEAASAWIARRDRGLTPAEQDAYFEWLYADPRHGRAMQRQERIWAGLNKLEQWRPAHSAIPNPDLLAPHRRSARLYWFVSGLAAAAALVLAIYTQQPAATATATETVPRREAIVHPGPERQTLADGSIVELNQGAEIEVMFTADERRVRLVKGEAFFTVARQPERPFFVETAGVAVRAIGTAFSVALGQHDVAVLVTQGTVEVLDVSKPITPDGSAEPVVLTAGQRTVVKLMKLRPANPRPVVQDVTPAEVDRALSWQGMRLEFVEMPLRDVVATFNRYNRRKLSVDDPEIAHLLVGGNFRADNVDAFVRLLDSGFGIASESQADEVVLRRVR
jgi:transmembrane sensor